MNVKWKTMAPLSAAALLLIAGCASPEARIRERPEVFAQLTGEEQELIRDGEIDIGFTEEMVWLALGQPDNVREVVGEEDRDAVWEYVTYRDGDARPLYTGFYHYWYRDPLHPYYLFHRDREPHARFEITFDEGRVVSYTRLTS